MKKNDIETRGGIPCLNVKCYQWPRPSQIAARLNCSEELAEKASELAFQSACESFWEDSQEGAVYHLGNSAKVFSAGRSSGWLIVKGLAPVESWDAIPVARWSRFAKAIASDIAYRSSLDSVCESIEVNQWHLEGAELFNFIDRKDGTIACIAELKQQAISAGFAPIIR